LGPLQTPGTTFIIGGWARVARGGSGFSTPAESTYEWSEAIVTNKEINRVSGRLFEGLLPPSWALRSQEDQEDYGIDGEIEITTPEDKATGLIFKMQLKGTENPDYDKDGQLPEARALDAGTEARCRLRPVFAHHAVGQGRSEVRQVPGGEPASRRLGLVE
jgi:hypothetical protein